VTPRAARTVTVTRAGGPGNSAGTPKHCQWQAPSRLPAAWPTCVKFPAAASAVAAPGERFARRPGPRAGPITRRAAAGGGGPRGGRRGRPSEPEAQSVPPPLAAAAAAA
jgi:hypothetical protein